MQNQNTTITMKHMRKAVKLFKNSLTPKSTQRHNQKKWLESIATLGDRHILAVNVQKKITLN